MTDHELRKKWNARYTAVGETPPALEVLLSNAHLLPAKGLALDLASGLGGSALYLARRGLRTWAWDLSQVAIDALKKRAGNAPLEAEVRDVIADPPEAERFDVICVGHFLDRGLCPDIAAALRPGGLLFYQTFTKDSVDDSGPRRAAFRLATNELLGLFPQLIVRFYREEGRVGDISQGLRNRAQLVAQRPVRDGGQ